MWNVFYGIVLVAILLVGIAILAFVVTDRQHHDKVREGIRIGMVAIIVIAAMVALFFFADGYKAKQDAERKKMVEDIIFGDGLEISTNYSPE